MQKDTGTLVEQYTWNSVNLNYLVGYSSCVNIKVTETGLILKTSLLFRLFHNSVFLPWSVVEELKYKKFIFFRSVKFYIGNTRIVIYGQVAESIKNVYSSYLTKVGNTLKSIV
ncbi:MAG: hypothetical protein GY795_45760 [Desulfobacterales bacterium]|nr:hypothetical protein [Desulfobacterales bacterium]